MRWSIAFWFLISYFSEHDFHYILFAKSAEINFSRRILGESFQHTEEIALHNPLQNDSHKNQVLGERQREAGQVLQTEVTFHHSLVSQAEKNSLIVLNRLSVIFTRLFFIPEMIVTTTDFVKPTISSMLSEVTISYHPQHHCWVRRCPNLFPLSHCYWELIVRHSLNCFSISQFYGGLISPT